MVDSQPWENTVNTCLSWASLWVFLEFIVNWPDFMPNEKCVVSNGFIFCSPFVLWVVNTVCFDLTYLLLLWMCVFVPVHSQILVYFNLISPPPPNLVIILKHPVGWLMALLQTCFISHLKIIPFSSTRTWFWVWTGREKET